MALLKLENATKRYGKLTAANQVSFEAHPGRILGFLGPNGAGKTTTIRMIAHITAPDEGNIFFDGRPVGAWSQQQMGYLPEERGLYKKLKVGDQLRYLAQLKGVSAADSKSRISYWLDRMGLTDWAGAKTQDLSKGMQQKMQFIATVLAEPRLVILDEPFSGLDPVNSELLRTIIAELKDEGRTILFASHRMEQVEQLCDDICLVAKGRVVLTGTLREVKRRYSRDKLALEFEGGSDIVSQITASAGVKLLEHKNDCCVLQLSPQVDAMAILDQLRADPNRKLLRFELLEPTLTEIFIKTVDDTA
ncbi:MAG: ATP-binding cassette domain-containing protein [Bacteroidota bacterium]|nr:ATP-binding cassette domain-containing protein [Bacteroidota bacterium]MDE2833512.1 ATP-binding cassette domain-containing protein [Bacteroidota bacterium]MDE2958213.1 ATP-binding cassette domain-containing protein [Bacteroidota bacterium]